MKCHNIINLHFTDGKMGRNGVEKWVSSSYSTKWKQSNALTSRITDVRTATDLRCQGSSPFLYRWSVCIYLINWQFGGHMLAVLNLSKVRRMWWKKLNQESVHKLSPVQVHVCFISSSSCISTSLLNLLEISSLDSTMVVPPEFS